MTAKTRTKRTESEMLGLLRKRHARTGNGGSGEFALLEHVRADPGQEATTTIDAIAVCLWKSRGHEMHAFEVKCSRADWLRELSKPHKADRIIARVDRFYVVAADDSIVRAGELPPTWGLLVAEGNRLVCKVEAPKLDVAPERRFIDRGWLVCLLRAAGAALTDADPAAIRAARAEGREAGVESARKQVDDMRHGRDGWQERALKAERDLNELRRELSGNATYGIDHGDLIAAIRMHLNGTRAANLARSNLERLRREVGGIVDSLDRALETEAT